MSCVPLESYAYSRYIVYYISLYITTYCIRIYIFFFLNTVCIVRLRIYIAKSDEECNPNRYYHLSILNTYMLHTF